MSAAVALGFVGLRALQPDADVASIADVALPSPVGPPPGSQPSQPVDEVTLRIHAPAGRCWSATIAGRPLRDGCGSTAFPLEVEGFVLVHVELMSGHGQVTAMFEADGRVVQTVGPTTGKYPSFDIAYRVPGSP